MKIDTAARWPLLELRPPGGFDLIVADPPWPFELRSAAGAKKAPPYTPLPVKVIQGLPIEALAARDALLLLWTTAPTLPAGVRTVKRWGFRYASFVVWTKKRSKGGAAIGPGYRVRTMAEICLVAVRGSPKHQPLPGLFHGLRREHSRKPDEFYDLVDLQCPLLDRRLDLFSRQVRPGWVSVGDEVDKFEPLKVEPIPRRPSLRDWQSDGFLAGWAP